jgi:hypothetical protein
VTKRHTQTARRQPLDESESTFDFRRDRDDRDVRRPTVDFRQDLSAVKFVARNSSRLP